ncbi:AAA ATPase domain-containing protein [Streptosporangium subroseum]|uniref:AAA ATPase domain-containing protein n=1 Tax=Streptosporangium subroseum TaxID=106412 RepID=A0A239IMQ2_9ACTN|nr:AAA family ATPase [Streptosporangium subroseum]SNS94845.1 AAA ATPase domain-containing protein [Streptosporangium subroseum]
MLYGRSAEQGVIDRLLSDSRSGRSGTLLIRGEPGIGKTALLDYAATAAEGLRMIRGTGVESEAELPFAGLHLLLRPVLDQVGALPEHQERALRAAFGLASVEAGDRLLVGLAVLSLLSELAEDGPLLVLVDDAQWLDRASTDALLFAARRLDAEGVVLIFAAREPFTAPGVPELPVKGLDVASAAALLNTAAGTSVAINPAVRYRLLAEARGNPLALIELPAAAPSDGTALPLTSRVQDAFLSQVRVLPEATQGLLAVAAAEDTGDLDVVLRAAAGFGDFLEDLHPAERAGLVLVDAGTMTFRHPLVRAAVYQGIPPSLRLAVHKALAEALDRPDDADRRAWHLAMSATGPDEEVAAELERTAVRASDRSGYAAAATAYERAARLSARPESRARRLTLAADHWVHHGDPVPERVAIAERRGRAGPAGGGRQPARTGSGLRDRTGRRAGPGGRRDRDVAGRREPRPGQHRGAADAALLPRRDRALPRTAPGRADHRHRGPGHRAGHGARALGQPDERLPGLSRRGGG